MKLLYLWMENYNDRIKNQGFSFSPEYLIHFDNDLNKLFISKNEKWCWQDNGCKMYIRYL